MSHLVHEEEEEDETDVELLDLCLGYYYKGSIK